MSMNNCDLLKLYIEDDDKGALSQFFLNQFDRLYRIALSYVKKSADAEDVLQDAFISVMTKAKSITKENLSNEFVISAWVTRVVINSCKVKLREAKSRHKREQVKGNEKMDNAMQNTVGDDRKSDDGVTGHIHQMINQLPVKYRLPIHLRYVEELSYEEISEILKDKPSTIRVRLKRGLDMLRENLKAEGVVTSNAMLLLSLANRKVVVSHEKAAAIVHNAIQAGSVLTASGSVGGGVGSGLLLKGVLIVSSLVGVAFVSTYLFSEKVPTGKVVVNKELSLSAEESKETWPKKWDFTKKEVPNIRIFGSNQIYDEGIRSNVGSNLIWDEAKRSYVNKEGEFAMANLLLSYTDKPIMLTVSVMPKATLQSTKSVIMIACAWGKDGQVTHYNSDQFFKYSILEDEKTIELLAINAKDQLIDQKKAPIRYKVNQSIFDFRFLLYQGYIFSLYKDHIMYVTKYEGDLVGSELYLGSSNYYLRSAEAKQLSEKDALAIAGDVIQKLQNKDIKK